MAGHEDACVVPGGRDSTGCWIRGGLSEWGQHGADLKGRGGAGTTGGGQDDAVTLVRHCNHTQPLRLCTGDGRDGDQPLWRILLEFLGQRALGEAPLDEIWDMTNPAGQDEAHMG